MYAFRKPFSAATYDGLTVWGQENGFSLKTAFVISQVMGYALSKYLGIKICSEIPRRAWSLLLVGLILFAELTLLAFATLPRDLKIIAIFFNGMPLGMVWGLVVRYLEGRRTSEILLAGLSCSYILASGIVKDVGRALMTYQGISQFWMPAATGACFLLPFLMAVWLLHQMPPPDELDVAARTKRQSMDRESRWRFFFRFAPGIVLLLVVYFFLTAYRDYRDNYQADMFIALGYLQTPGVFSLCETIVAFVVMAVLAALFLVQDNRRGLMAVYAVMILGTAMLVAANPLLQAGYLTGLSWMIFTGLGAYLAYVPFGSVLFDRIIASTHFVGTAVFAIYLADALGYTGSVATQLYQEFLYNGSADAGLKQVRLEFFQGFTYAMAGVGVVLLLISCLYFLRQVQEAEQLLKGGEPSQTGGVVPQATEQPLPEPTRS